MHHTHKIQLAPRRLAPVPTKNKTQSGESSPEDRKLLEQCETTIQRGVRNFLAVGHALCTIRKKRLYKINGFETFEDYCQKKWNISRQYASQLILTFRLNEQLSTAVDKPAIDSPHLAKRFRKLDPDQQKEMAGKARAGGDLRAEIEKAEQKKSPSEFLQAKKLSLQLWELLQSASDKDKMLEAISVLVVWITDYLDTKEKTTEQKNKEHEFEVAI